MYNLGVASGEMLKFDMAIVFYEIAFHFNPHYAEACNNLGVIYKGRDNLDKAIKCYQSKMDAAASMIEKAIIANPTYTEAYNNLGVLYRDAGDIALAISAYEQCLKIDPDPRNAGQNRLLAMDYIDEGNEGSPAAMRESLRIAFIKEQYGTNFCNFVGRLGGGFCFRAFCPYQVAPKHILVDMHTDHHDIANSKVAADPFVTQVNNGMATNSKVAANPFVTQVNNGLHEITEDPTKNYQD
ncbi:hypothetical protein KIW84_033153 [Lathyrus oleraceus]|uniref:UDP-N-acetylglucosamine--peptide N-acetylglucosaminyltransferase SPINDLY n=1 Tax=Pisum sativum TaxID=3888 RepID=A0A9D4XX98_PEA|nr:hypothetical protein KIW84_033153 [Pisum sativum]